MSTGVGSGAGVAGVAGVGVVAGVVAGVVVGIEACFGVFFRVIFGGGFEDSFWAVVGVGFGIAEANVGAAGDCCGET